MAAAVVSLLLSGAPAGAACPSLDDFEDGTTQGWIHGVPNPYAPVNVPDGGPGGVGDAYCRVGSGGGFGPGSMLVMLNWSQWTGNLASCALMGVSFDAKNEGGDALFLRVAFQTGSGRQYSSTSPVVLPADGQWHSVAFGLTDVAMTQVQGSAQTVPNALGNVTELRILSAEFGPDWRGDAVRATLGVDNVRALQHPPTGVEHETWGGVKARLGDASE